MSYTLLYAHLKTDSIIVKEGQILNGKQKLGTIGSTGFAIGAHLHFQVENNAKSITDFGRSNANPVNPDVVINKYGKPSPNDVTLKYLATGPAPYSTTKKHLGIDYSGNIDKSYESKYAYSLPEAKCKVLEIGYSPNAFGKYVILEVLGKKEDKKEIIVFYSKGSEQGKVDINVLNHRVGRDFYERPEKGSPLKKAGRVDNLTIFFNGIYKYKETGWLDAQGRMVDFVAITDRENNKYEYFMPIYYDIDVVRKLDYSILKT